MWPVGLGERHQGGAGTAAVSSALSLPVTVHCSQPWSDLGRGTRQELLFQEPWLCLSFVSLAGKGHVHPEWGP
jgi:hypothetical protein